MSKVAISYRNLKASASEARSVAVRLESYASELERKIYRKLGNYSGTWSVNLSNAKSSINNKVNSLYDTADRFRAYENNLNGLRNECIRVDTSVKSDVSLLFATFKDAHGIRNNKARDAINNMISKFANMSAFTRRVNDMLEERKSNEDFLKSSIKHWYDYEGGKDSVKEALTGVFGIAAAVAAVISLIISGNASLAVAAIIAVIIAILTGIIKRPEPKQPKLHDIIQSGINKDEKDDPGDTNDSSEVAEEQSTPTLPFQAENNNAVLGDGLKKRAEDRWHHGIDISGIKAGTPLLAPSNGTVLDVKWNTAGGINLYILHDDGHITVFSHCNTNNSDDRELLKGLIGQSVIKGQPISNADGSIVAKVGNSGMGKDENGNPKPYNAHIHLEVYKIPDGLTVEEVNIKNYMNKVIITQSTSTKGSPNIVDPLDYIPELNNIRIRK